MKKDSASQPDAPGELVIYPGKEGRLRLQARLRDDTLWLTQKQMAEVFGVDVRTISEHLKNIFQTHELDEAAVIRKFRTTAADGKDYLTGFYNLDAVIAVDFAEDQAERRKQIFMADWETRLDDFLRFNDRKVLPDAGKRTRKQADEIAHAEFEKFADRRRAEKENAGAVENIRALESAAKLLEPVKAKHRRKKKEDGA
jgi:hypothetical protein